MLVDLDAALIKSDVVGYLKQHEKKELLRLVVIGSVDDGKSTLIGRLLHDTHGIYEDQLAAVRKASAKGATRGQASASELDLSLLTDGLRAEREQGITIDVAYRYFSTTRRKFIIADTPGHVQYTRNMATGASTADVAVILIDARHGVLAQTRRHAFIASLLGIPHLVACVNKMDLVGWDRDVYATIAAELTELAGRMGVADVRCLPVSALRGDGIVERGDGAPWYDGPTLLEHLEQVPIADDRNLGDLRFPIQYVIRPDLDYRGFAGQLASGVLAVGDEIAALPSGRRSKVAAIDTYDGPLQEAFAPMSVTVRLTDEIDVSRGDMLIHAVAAPATASGPGSELTREARQPVGRPPVVARELDVTLVWMAERAMDPARTYLLKHTSRQVRVDIASIGGVISPETLTSQPASRLVLNEIGRVTLRCHTPLFVDPYLTNRVTGAFILIDGLSNDTVAAGMIARAITEDGDRARSAITPSERAARTGHAGAVVTIGGDNVDDSRRNAYLVERALFDAGWLAAVVPGVAGPAVASAGVIAIVADSTATELLALAPDVDPRLREAAATALSPTF